MSFEALVQQAVREVVQEEEQERVNLENEKKKQVFTNIDIVLNNCVKLEEIHRLLLNLVKVNKKPPTEVSVVDILLPKTHKDEPTTIIKPRPGYMENCNFDNLRFRLDIETIEQYMNLDELAEYVEISLNSMNMDIGKYKFSANRAYLVGEKCDFIMINIERIIN